MHNFCSYQVKMYTKCLTKIFLVCEMFFKIFLLFYMRTSYDTNKHHKTLNIKKVKIRHTRGDNFTYMGTRPAERTKTKLGMRGRIDDVVICFKFYVNRLRGFELRGQK